MQVMATSKKNKKVKYEATETARVGSNKDGTPRYHFQLGKLISLTDEEANKYKKYIKWQQ